MKHSCTLFLRDMDIMARVGIFPQEKKRKTRLRISLEIDMKRKPGRGARETIDDLISYGDMALMIRSTVESRHFDLIETLADAILDEVKKDKRAHAMRVTIDKINAFTPMHGLLDGVDCVGVRIERKRK